MAVIMMLPEGSLDELVGLISWWNLSWCIGGNFNVIHYPIERYMETHYSQELQSIHTWYNNNDNNE